MSPHNEAAAICDRLAGDLRAARVREQRLELLLRECRAQIEYLHEKFQATGSGEMVLARIGAELGEAG